MDLDVLLPEGVVSLRDLVRGHLLHLQDYDARHDDADDVDNGQGETAAVPSRKCSIYFLELRKVRFVQISLREVETHSLLGSNLSFPDHAQEGGLFCHIIRVVGVNSVVGGVLLCHYLLDFTYAWLLFLRYFRGGIEWHFRGGIELHLFGEVARFFHTDVAY